MARPLKQGLDYFPYDVDLDLDDKLAMIIGEFGASGETVYTKLLCWIYKNNGYYTVWNEQEQFKFAKRFAYAGITVNLAKEVASRCVKWELFDQDVFNMFNVLTSIRIQNTWLDASRKRKDRVVDQNIWLIEVNGVSAAEVSQFIPPEIPKVNERKSNEIKKNVVPAKPPRKKDSRKSKVEEDSNPIWAKLIDAWFHFNVSKFPAEPSFDGPDPRHLKNICDRLKKRAEKKNIEWTAETAVDRLYKFLNSAFEDDWLSKHFLLKNLDSQFDQVILEQNKKVATTETVQDTSKELQFLFDRYLDDEKIDMKLITDSHINFLNELGVLDVTQKIMDHSLKQRIKSLSGSNESAHIRLANDYMRGETTREVKEDIPNLMRIANKWAVIQLFNVRKSQNEKGLLCKQV
jgi:hypothetical protein